MTFMTSPIVKTEEFSPVPSTVPSSSIVCLVCARSSNTGHHYGVTACLGCKTFFRRVVLQGGSPKCKNNGKCGLQKGGVTKRICRRCRFEKCKSIGMKEEALHPCRDLIGRRRYSESVSSDDSPTSSQDSVGKLSETAEDALSFLLGLRNVDCEFRSKLAEEYGHTVEEKGFYKPSFSVSELEIRDDLSKMFEKDVHRLREWVHKVPCFNQLTPSTRNFLLHRFCLMYSILELSLFSNSLTPSSNLWILPNKTALVRGTPEIPQFLRNKMNTKSEQEQLLLLPLISLLIDDISLPLRNVRPSQEEIAALKVLMLMKPTILRESSSHTIQTEEDRRIIRDVRNRILLGLNSYYIQNKEEKIEERTNDLIMISGGIEICASQCLENLRMMRFFDIMTFDKETEAVIFGDER